MGGGGGKGGWKGEICGVERESPSDGSSLPINGAIPPF